MTNKEAKEKLYMEWQKFLEDNIDYAGISEAYKIAFKALEQEPCEDCISRQAVLDIFAEKADATRPYSEAWETVKKLPPVTPQPKTGHWEKNTDGLFCFHTCSCCGNLAPKVGQYFPPYCPECGARMAESEE